MRTVRRSASTPRIGPPHPSNASVMTVRALTLAVRLAGGIAIAASAPHGSGSVDRWNAYPWTRRLDASF